jgi:hypothetical protein
LKLEKGIIVSSYLAQLLSANEHLLRDLTLSELPKKTLVLLARMAVHFDAFALLEMIKTIDRRFLEATPKIYISRNSIYSMAKTPEMLRQLFKYEIPVPSIILAKEGTRPFVYHFMSSSVPGFKDAIKTSQIIPAMNIMDSVAYCKRVGALELQEEIAAIIGFIRIED